MKSIDLGQPMDEMMGPKQASDPQEEKEVYYPTVYLSAEDNKYTELTLGQKVTLVGVVVSKSENTRTDAEDHSGAEIEVRSLQLPGTATKDSGSGKKKTADQENLDTIDKGFKEAELSLGKNDTADETDQ